MEEEFLKAIEDKISNEEKARRIIEYIKSNKPMKLIQLTEWALENNVYNELRKAQYLYMKMLQE